MTSGSILTGYNFIVLNEDAATEDLFEDQTHEKVSENLCNIICSSPRGITIGLEGAWGSGKSSVVKLLQDKLQKRDEKLLFFTFDAWAHDGDPLRRIFLESLIGAIDPNEQMDFYSSLKEEISARKKTVKINARKSASRLGKLISLAALCIPLGSALLSKVNLNELTLPWLAGAGSINYPSILGFFFLVAPFLVLLYWLRFGDKDRKTNKVCWDFFTTESKEDYLQDVTEHGERTSIEFEEFFRRIMCGSIEHAGKEKFVIVVDNLDRIDPSHAKNVWSTLQTFFQKRSGNVLGRNDWINKITFLMPFDRDGFDKIWSEASGSSFLMKCFQLILEVPDPVMSGWAKYTADCIERSFIGWPGEDKETVLQVFVKNTSRLETSPTPREIKFFINQVGVLASVWAEPVSIASVAFYALLKIRFKTAELRQKLLKGEIINHFYSGDDRAILYSEIAGLMFGVPSSKGFQLLLAPEIKSAFDSGNADKLTGLVKVHDPAFWIAFSATKDERRIYLATPEEELLAHTKALSGLVDYRQKIVLEIRELDEIWMNSFSRRNLGNFDYCDSIDQMMKLVDNPEKFIEAVFGYADKKLNSVVSSIVKEDFPSHELGYLNALLELLNSRNMPIPKKHYPQLDCAHWRAWNKFIGEIDCDFDMVLPNKDYVITQLAEEAGLNGVQLVEKDVLLLLSTYRKYPKSEEWTAVGHSIVAWLSRHDRAFDCETLYRLVAMLIAGGPKGVVQALTTCVQGDAFWQRGRLSSVALIPSLPIVAALALQGKVQHNGFVSDEVKEFWKIDGDQDQLNRVYFQFLQLKIQRVFWALATDNRNKLAIGVIRKFKLKELYSSGWGVHYIDEYDWLAGEELLEVARLLVENGSFVSNKDNMQGKLDDYFKVYSILMRLNLAEVDEFVGAEVDSVSEDNWYKYLSENVLIFGLIKGKNHRFSEAFGRHLDKILSGECALDARYRNSGLIRELLSKVVDASTILFPRIVKKYFGAEDDRLKDADFDALKDFISPYVREVSPADYVPRLNKWLDACDYKKIDWFLEQEIVKSEMPSEGLLSRVKGGMSADNSELKNIVKRLNDKLQLGVVAVDFESNSP